MVASQYRPYVVALVASIVPFVVNLEYQQGFAYTLAAPGLLVFLTQWTCEKLRFGVIAFLQLPCWGHAAIASSMLAIHLLCRERNRMKARFGCGWVPVDPTCFIRRSLGVFDVGGSKYYRSTVLSSPQLLTPSSLKIKNEGLANAETIVEYTLTPLATGSCESVLASRPLPRGLLRCDRPKWLVNIAVSDGGTGIRGIGMGWREKEYLFFARHLIHAPNLLGYGRELVLYTEHCSVRFTPTAENTHVLDDCPKHYKHTGWDLLALKLPLDTWSVLGVGSCTSKTYVSCGEGAVIVYGNPDGETLVSAGALAPNPAANKRGLVSHNCSTTPSFSGSPIVTHRGGSLKIAGSHISGVTEGLGDIHNHGVSFWTIFRLRKQLGLIAPLVLNPPVEASESREKERQQEDWDWEIPAESERSSDAGEDPESDLEEEDETLARGRGRAGANALKRAQGGAFEHVLRDARDANERVGADIDHTVHGAGTATRDRVRGDGKQPNAAPGTWRPEKDESESPSKDILDGTFAWLTSSGHSSIKLTEVMTYYDPGVSAHSGSYEAVLGLFWDDARFAIELRPISTVFRPDQDQVTIRLTPCPTPQLVAAADALPGAAPADVRRFELACSFADQLPAAAPPPKKDSSESVAVEWYPLTKGVAWRKPWKDCKASPEAPPHSFTPATPVANPDPAALTAILHKVLAGDLTSLPELIGKDVDEVFNHAAVSPLRAYSTKCNASWGPSKHRKSTCYPDSNGLPCFTRCGAYSCYTKAKKGDPTGPTPMSPKFIKACAKHGVNLSTADGRSCYVLPPKGGAGISASLKHQAARQRVGNFDKLSFEEFESWCASYPTTDCPAIRDTIPTLEKLIASFDPSKSAGWSSNARPGTKGVWMEGDARSALIELTLCRLIMRSVCSPNLGNMTPMAMCQYGLVDPRILFPKIEATASEKSDLEIWRLIWGVSVLDALSQLIPHYAQNKADIAAFQDGSLNMQGIGGGHHDEGIKRTGEVFEWLAELGLLLQCSDARSWDMSVSRDGLMLDTERRMRLSDITDPRELNAFCFLLYTEGLCNSSHVVAFEGQLWESERFGITASGVPSTSAQNSPVRGMQFLACGGKRVHTVGDDLIGAGNASRELLTSCGTILKGEPTYSPPEGPHSLTSHTYTRPGPIGTPWLAKFENFNKLLAHIELRRDPGCPPLDDQVKGALFAIRHDKDQTATMRSILAEMDWRSDLPAEDVCSDGIY